MQEELEENSKSKQQKPEEQQLQKKRKLKKGWQVFVAVFLALSLPLGLIALKLSLDFRSQAGPTEKPSEVVASNISDSTAVISFQTLGNKTSALVNYTDETGSQSGTVFDSRAIGTDDRYNLHYHKLNNLKPDTTYTFTITVGSENYTDPLYIFTTASTPDSIPAPRPIYGKVEGSSFPEGIVYAHIEDGLENSTTVSELIPENGAYTLDLVNANFSDSRSTQNKTMYVFVNVALNGKGSVLTNSNEDEIPVISVTLTHEDYDPGAAQGGNIRPTITTTPTSSPSITIEPISSPSPTPTPIITNSVQPQSSDFLLFSKDSQSPNETDPKAPENIFVSNISETSFTVNWTTRVPTEGSVVYAINSPTLTKRTLDARDTQSNIQKRYTHGVNLSGLDISQEDLVNFRLLVDGVEYPKQNQYSYTPPPILDSPPSPTSIDGSIEPQFEYSPEKNDFLIFTKVNSNSTWVSGVTKDVELTWNLPIGNARSEDLSSYTPANESSTFQIHALGEYNSANSTTTSGLTQLTNIKLNPGITFTNVEENDLIPPGGAISGFAPPLSDVEIFIGSFSDTTKSNEKGEWNYSLPITLTSGNQIIKISSGGKEMTMNISIQELEDLPITAIQDYLIYIPGVIILLFGLYLSYWTNKQRDLK